jgi:splicing factor 3A subunit 1
MAQEEVSESTMDTISRVPPGVLLPPKEQRAAIEKVAGFVARNGAAFEARMRNDQANATKLAFIFEDDPYYSYYAWRREECKAGRGTDVAAGRVGEAVPKPTKPKGPEPPPDFLFSARMPTINAQDLEIVKLTALYVAKNGRNWMTQLSQREAGNYQFDFLRPQHSLNQFFNRLVDQYQLLISSTTVEGGKAERARIAEIQKIVNDKYIVLDRAKKRAEWVKHQEDQRVKKQEKEEEERKEYASIDWDDFQVIGEIFFTDADETFELPGPTSLNDLQSASLEQRGKVSRQLIEEAMPTEDMSQWQQHYPTPAPPVQPVQPQYPMAMPYGPTPPAQPAQPAFSPPFMPQIPVADDASRSASPAVPAPKRIVQNAAPRAAARRGRVAMATCPNCKQQIPYDELEQHMKSESLPTILIPVTNTIMLILLHSRTSRSTMARAKSQRGTTSCNNQHLYRRCREQSQTSRVTTYRCLRSCHGPKY